MSPKLRKAPSNIDVILSPEHRMIMIRIGVWLSHDEARKLATALIKGANALEAAELVKQFNAAALPAPIGAATGDGGRPAKRRR